MEFADPPNPVGLLRCVGYETGIPLRAATRVATTTDYESKVFMSIDYDIGATCSVTSDPSLLPTG